MGRLRIPRSEEAEKALLGSLLLRPQSFPEIMDMVDEESFYSRKNADVFRAISELFRRGEAIDAVTVAEEIYHNPDHIVDASYINSLMGMDMRTINAKAMQRLCRIKSVGGL